MPRIRNKKVDYLVYIVVRLVVCVLQAVPTWAALRFGSILALVAYVVDKRHRKVALDNLSHAFPEKSLAEHKRLTFACYRHFCTMLVEIIIIPRRIHVYNWRHFSGDHRLGELLTPITHDRPVLIVTAHFGNWEIAGYVLGLTGFKSYAIARILDNPHLEAFLKTFRQKTGQTIIPKNDSSELIMKLLDSNATIATLGDQDAGERGLFVPFFNRPASTHKAVALMSLQSNARMVVIGVPRVAWPMRYQIHVEEVIDPQDYDGRPGAVREMTERFTQAIERMVRRHPEQYFWLHRRWKHQPKPKKSTSSTNA